MPEAPPPDAPRGFSFFGRQRESAPVDVPGMSAGQVIGDFRLVRPLGQGGMGQVWEAVQLSLGRTVALKLVRPERITEKTLALFAREARAGGRLHHPHLVTVHGHGTDGGIAWIAMELVEGSWTLRDFLDEAAKSAGVPAGYYSDAAAFIAKVADALHSAHLSAVIHRDLKPQNILIDPKDDPKVTDFGLAKLTDEAALSVTGEFAGTYWYMSPEQVAAKRMGLDHRTDIFSLGVVLYEILAQRRPFDGDTAHQVAEQVMTIDPPELRTVRSRIPRDLAVITAKCLEKARDRRYATMADLAADLRRYLRNDPIHAKAKSPLVKFGLWARRNPTKSVAGAVAAVAFIAISALLAENVTKTRRLGEANTNLEETIGERNDLIDQLGASNEQLEQQTEQATESARLAQIARDEATQRANDVLRLSAIQDYEDLIAEAEDLWPAYPEKVAAYERWIVKAQTLVDELPRHYAKRAELRAKALPQSTEEREAERQAHTQFPKLAELEAALMQARGTDGSDGKTPTPADPENVTALEGELAALRTRLDERQDWRFPEGEDNARWWHANLSKLIAALEAMNDPRSGLLSPESDAVSQSHGWSMPRRLDFARTISERSVSGAEASELWAEAITAITASPKYGDLELMPQLGLLPIGMDPDSEHWEFAHLASGDAAVRDPGTGRLILTSATGIVLVLLPAGGPLLGSVRDPNEAHFDPEARTLEEPRYRVDLAAFFLGKHELTQAQWSRTTGTNPSFYRKASFNLETDPMHPVESITWFEAQSTLRRLNLVLPTEAQWEYACRAGTESLWFTGDDIESLRGYDNLGDAATAELNFFPPNWRHETALRDEFYVHAPAGSLRTNPFGLHAMLGNVSEWCQDRIGSYDIAAEAGTGLRTVHKVTSRVTRGGSFFGLALDAKSAHREFCRPDERHASLGVRPAQMVVR